TVNNPHATGYDCGACGGHTGEANARVVAEVLNNKKVRSALVADNLLIPTNTIFLACLHDTTTDEVSIFNEYDVPAARKEELNSLQRSLVQASQATRTERSLRMSAEKSSSIDQMILGRSKDWSQTRPEWGLAGCSTFVVAPRQRTKAVNLEGKSFLHSYEWKNDPGFSILELIMTAPMVVTSWINLQYYGSTVDNKTFGSGNKTLHNVTAGLGVLEGYSGDLRVGLPWQAIHDGEKYQHQPEKLTVVIEAPIEAINVILSKHQSVRDLVDNGWIYLMVMNEEGKVTHKYSGGLQWDSIAQAAA
ncbi:MAG: putative inorganic carbon transporter subunit DabA, partial [Algoriphagus sp.]|uniref:putative inorganic carbon transporter subunit DabA n=1 Tax=Algoriphagus sp. TaxID=1872435 RepID=UPI003299E4A8